MQRLSLELLEKNILNEKDADYVVDVPNDLDPILFDKFLRVMAAKSPNEITDITDEEVIKMLEDGARYFNVLTFENFFDESLFGRISAQKSVTSVRRIL